MVVFYIWNIVSFAKIFTEAETGQRRAQAISWGWVSQSPHSIPYQPSQPTDVDGEQTCKRWLTMFGTKSAILREDAMQSMKQWKSIVWIGGDYLFKRAFFTSSPRIALSIHSIVKHRVHVWLGEGGRARIKLIKVLFVIVMRAAGTGRRSLSEKLVTSFEYNLDVNCRFWLSRWGDVPAAGCGDDGCLLWQLLTVHCPPAAASTHAHMGDYS